MLMTQILITTDTYDTHELFNEIKKKSDAYKTMQISRKKKHLYSLIDIQIIVF